MYKLILVLFFSFLFSESNAENKKDSIVYRVNGKVVSSKKFDENTLRQHKNIVKEYPELFESPKKSKKS